MSIKTLKIDLTLCESSLSRLKNERDEKEGEMNDFDKYEYLTEDRHNDYLDQEGDHVVCGMSFLPSQILKELDLIAYNESFSNHADSLELEDFEEYRDLVTDLSDLEDEIADQESDIEMREEEIEELEEG